MPKVVLVVLILLAVLFVIVLASGSTPNAGQPLPKDPMAAAQTNPAPPWANTIGKLIAPFSPKLKLQPSTFTFGALDTTVAVPESLTDDFRSAAFQITMGCQGMGPDHTPSDCSNVSIVYQDPVKEGPSPKLQNQPWQGLHDHPDQGSLLILKHGGTLTFHCYVTPQCAAQLQ